MLISGLSTTGQNKGKGRPFSGAHAAGDHPALMDSRNVLHQVEPQPAAFGRHIIGSPHLVEFFENAFDLRFFNADAVVLEADGKMPLLVLEKDVDGGGFGYIVFDGVGEEIDQEHLEKGNVNGAKE